MTDLCQPREGPEGPRIRAQGPMVEGLHGVVETSARCPSSETRLDTLIYPVCIPQFHALRVNV